MICPLNSFLLTAFRWEDILDINRSQVTYEQLSPHLVNTLLLSEDHRFYDHSGLDFQAYLSVLYGSLNF